MLRKDDDGWSNPKVLTIFVVIFLCGAGFGAVATREYLHSKIQPPPSQETMQMAQRVGLIRLKDQLSLTADQEKIVTKELDDYAKFYQNIEEQRADVAEVGKQRILNVLNEAQRRKFNEIFSKPAHR